MEFPIDDLKSFNNFKFRGTNLDREIAADVQAFVITPLCAVPYLRSMGTTLKSSLQKGITISRELDLAIQVVESVQGYNDTFNDSPKYERRVSMPFEDIEFALDSDKQHGELALIATYTQLKDLRQRQANI